MKLALLFLGAAIVAFTASSSVVSSKDENTQSVYNKGEFEFETKSTVSPLLTTESPDDGNDVINEFDDDFSDEEEEEDDDDVSVIDGEAVVDGIQLKYLTSDEVYDLLEDDDNLVMAELDIAVAKSAISARLKGDTAGPGDDFDIATGTHRRKRFLGPLVPLLVRAIPPIVRGGASVVRAARPLFKGSTLTKVNVRRDHLGTVTQTTKHYTRQGGMSQARQDFSRFGIRNPKPIQGGAGQTGRIGNHDITVRPRSTEGSPTLSIRSRRPGGDVTTRKFRYPEN